MNHETAQVKASREKKNAQKREQPRLNRRKVWLFRFLTALGAPMVFLGVAELILRLAGFGYPTRFLLHSQRDGQPVFVQNDCFGWRFFGAQMARIPNPICVPQMKGSNTVRIIVFGESAAMGDPQPDFGLPRMLQAMLELRYPGRHFEIVNAAMTAIDSNVILPIAHDCSAASADIWVIYMGNNEVVGPFGAGTVFGRQVPPLPLIRAALSLKATRIGQLADAIQSQMRKPPVSESEWGGMEMFLNQQVCANDARMNAVYEHFAGNLSAIIKTGIRNGAGIVVSTLAVNLKDCAPFASRHRQDLTDSDKSKWETLFQNGISAQSAGKIQEAAGWYQEAAKIDNEFAELRFRQGSCALALGENAIAQRQFVAARDLDTLRFRCDSRLNELIRQTVSKSANPQVVLADGERAIAEGSSDGLPGNDFFYDHVHLTFDGNYLLARTLAPKLENLLPKEIATLAAGRPWASETDCARRLAWSDWNKHQALAAMFSRLGIPPFTGQLNHDAYIQRLKHSLRELTPAIKSEGIKVAQTLCTDALATAPDDPVLREQLVVLDQYSGDLADATINAQRAVQLLPSSSEDWSQLGSTLAKQLRYDDAAAAFRQAFLLNPQDVWALHYLAQSLKDLGRRDDAIQEYRHVLTIKPRFGPAWLGLGQLFEKMGNKAEAENCYRKALLKENRIERVPELELLARFCLSRGWHEAAADNYDAALRLNSSDGALYLEAGENLETLGRQAQAEQCYAQASELLPDSIQAHFLYGLELGRDGKFAGATAQFREAVRIKPDMPESRLNLGIALSQEGNYPEALEQFDKVLAQNPSNAVALNYAQTLRQKLSATQPR